MVTKYNPSGMELMHNKRLCILKIELTQARGVSSMAMWDSVPVKNFILPLLHIQIGLGNDVLNRLLDLIDSDVEKLSTSKEVACNTLETLNQVAAKNTAKPLNMGCH